jgi:lipoprotein-anchoring transpeptidase ErfK/SrfK
LGEKIGRFGDYEFTILGGRSGYPTPTGAFQVEWKSRSWWSKQWNAEMPYSIFFHGGAAIHEGSLAVTSHGCVHVSGKAARQLYMACKEKETRVFVYP